MPYKIGYVTHFYPNISVAIVKLTSSVKKGDKISFQGNTTTFDQVVVEMECNHTPIEFGCAGAEVGIKVDSPVRENDTVYLV